MFREACALVGVSRSIGRRLISLGAPPAKVHFIPCGVDCEKFPGSHPEEAPPLFVAVARFVEKKAPQLTIQAFSQVLAAQPTARLKMVGDGPLLSQCQSLVQSLGIAGAVEFMGTQSHTVVSEQMHRARCFVQHSVEASSGDCEGTPVGIVEAGAGGLPVISTRHAGIPDVVVEGETGFLVDEQDVDGMAQHMIRIAADPVLAGRLGSAARKRIEENFSLPRTINALWELIRSCMTDGPPVSRIFE